jgi:hypothetical protein
MPQMTDERTNDAEGRKSMTAMPYLPTAAKPSLELALENAVVLSWGELMPTATSGMINVEFHNSPENLMEYLKVWASSDRGYWTMICEYWKCSLWSHVPGISFGKGYGPGDFSRRLENVMQHENDFDKAVQFDTLIQIGPPTANERSVSEGQMEAPVG